MRVEFCCNPYWITSYVCVLKKYLNFFFREIEKKKIITSPQTTPRSRSLISSKTCIIDEQLSNGIMPFWRKWIITLSFPDPVANSPVTNIGEYWFLCVKIAHPNKSCPDKDTSRIFPKIYIYRHRSTVIWFCNKFLKKDNIFTTYTYTPSNCPQMIWHSSKVLKLFIFPPNPKYSNSWQEPISLLK